jgi:hypothetical protein
MGPTSQDGRKKEAESVLTLILGRYIYIYIYILGKDKDRDRDRHTLIKI